MLNAEEDGAEILFCLRTPAIIFSFFLVFYRQQSLIFGSLFAGGQLPDSTLSPLMKPSDDENTLC